MAFENRPKDFFAKQIRSSHLIASGGIIDPESSDWDEQLPHLRLMIYPRDALEVGTSTGATEYIDGAFEGIIPPTLLNDVEYNDEGQVVGGSGLKVGQDVWLFISGAQGTTHMDHNGDGELELEELERRSDHGVVLFGGDVVISGTLFAEKQVIEVDLLQEGQLFVSGNLRAQDYTRDIHFVQFRSPGYREGIQYPDLWLSGEDAMLTYKGEKSNPKMWQTDVGAMTAADAGYTGFYLNSDNSDVTESEADEDGDGVIDDLATHGSWTEDEWAAARGYTNVDLSLSALPDADGTILDLTSLGADSLDNIATDVTPYYSIAQLNVAISAAGGAIFANRNDAIEAGAAFLAFNPGDTLAQSSVIFNVDSVYEQVGINTAVPSASLDVRRRKEKNNNIRSTIDTDGTWSDNGKEQVTFLLHENDEIGHSSGPVSNPLDGSANNHDDVSFYVWGVPDAKSSFSGGDAVLDGKRKSVAGFGGDVVISGTLYTENGVMDIASFHDNIGSPSSDPGLPDVPGDGTVLGILQFSGNEVVGNGSGPAARIEAEAAGDWSAGDIPGRLNFYTNSGNDDLTWNDDESSVGQNGLAMTIAHDKHVGIGTETPSEGLLHVYRNASVGNVGSGNTSNAAIRVQDSANNMHIDGNSITTDHFTYINVTAEKSFVLATHDTERFRIDSDGDVGIGDWSDTDVPRSRLDIRPEVASDALAGVGSFDNYHMSLRQKNGTNDAGIGIAFGNSSDEDEVGASVIFKKTGTASQGELQFYTKRSTSNDSSPEQAMVIDNAGNIGVGVPSPTGQVEIRQEDPNTDPALRLSYDDTNNTDFAIDTAGDLNMTPSGDAVRLTKPNGDGDIKLGFDITSDGISDWSIGIDNSDVDTGSGGGTGQKSKFKIGAVSSFDSNALHDHFLDESVLIFESNKRNTSLFDPATSTSQTPEAVTTIKGSTAPGSIFWHLTEVEDNNVYKSYQYETLSGLDGNEVKHALRILGLKEDNTDYHNGIDHCLKPKVLVATPEGDVVYTESVLGRLGQDRDSRYYKGDDSHGETWPDGTLQGDEAANPGAGGTPYDNGYIVPEYQTIDGEEELVHGWNGDTSVGHAIDDLNHGLREVEENNPWNWNDIDSISGGDVVTLKDSSNQIGIGTPSPDSKVHMARLDGHDIDIKIEASQYESQNFDPAQQPASTNAQPIARLDFSFDSEHWISGSSYYDTGGAGANDPNAASLLANAQEAALPALSIAAITRLGFQAHEKVDVLLQSNRAGSDVSIATQHSETYNGSTDLGTLSPFKIRGNTNRAETQVLILSGTTTVSDLNAPNPRYFSDVNFFVSGAIDSAATSVAPLGSGVRGTACFGGDVVVSGTLYANVLPIDSPNTPHVIYTGQQKTTVVYDVTGAEGVPGESGGYPTYPSFPVGSATSTNIHPYSGGLGDDPEPGGDDPGAAAYKSKLQVFVNGQLISPSEYCLDGSDPQAIKLKSPVRAGDKIVVDVYGQPNDWLATPGLQINQLLDVRTDRPSYIDLMLESSSDGNINVSYLGTIGSNGDDVPVRIIEHGSSAPLNVTWDNDPLSGTYGLTIELSYPPAADAPTVEEVAVAINNETSDLMANNSWNPLSGAPAPTVEDPTAGGADPGLTSPGNYSFQGGVDPLTVVGGETLQNIPEGAVLKWSRDAQTWYVAVESPGGTGGSGGGGGTTIAIKENDITEVAQATFINFEGSGVTVNPDGAGVTIAVDSSSVASLNDLTDVTITGVGDGAVLTRTSGTYAYVEYVDGTSGALLRIQSLNLGDPGSGTLTTSVPSSLELLEVGPTPIIQAVIDVGLVYVDFSAPDHKITLYADWSSGTITAADISDAIGRGWQFGGDGTYTSAAYGPIEVTATDVLSRGHGLIEVINPDTPGVFQAIAAGATYLFIGYVPASWTDVLPASGGSALAVEWNGAEQIAATESINFVGSTVAVSIDPDGVTTNVTIADPVSGIAGIAVHDSTGEVEDEATKLTFDGFNVAVGAAGEVNVSSTAAIYSDGYEVYTSLPYEKSRLNFRGAGVTANHDFENERINIDISPELNDLTDVYTADAVEGNILKRAAVVHNAKATIDAGGIGFTVTAVNNGQPGAGNVPNTITFTHGDVNPQFVWDDVSKSVAVTARFPSYGSGTAGVTPSQLQYALTSDASNSAAAAIITISNLVNPTTSLTEEITYYSPLSFYANTEYVWKRGREIVAMDTMTMVNADFTSPLPGTTGGDAPQAAGGIMLGVGGLEQPSPVILAATKQLWPAAASGGSDDRFGYVEFDYNDSAMKLRISTNENVIDSTGIRIDFEAAVAGDPPVAVTYERTPYDNDPMSGPPLDTFTVRIDNSGSVTAQQLKDAFNAIQGSSTGVNMLTVSFDQADPSGAGIINWDSFPRPGLIAGGVDNTPYIILNGTSNESAGWNSKPSKWRGLYTSIGYEPNGHHDITNKGYVDSAIQTFGNEIKQRVSYNRATPVTGGLLDITTLYDSINDAWPNIIPVNVSSGEIDDTIIELPDAGHANLVGNQMFVIKDEGGTAGDLAGTTGRIVIRPKPGQALDEYTQAAPLEIESNYASITLYTNGIDKWHVI